MAVDDAELSDTRTGPESETDASIASAASTLATARRHPLTSAADSTGTNCNDNGSEDRSKGSSSSLHSPPIRPSPGVGGGLAKSDSVPVIGTMPYGSLRIHQPMDIPPQQPPPDAESNISADTAGRPPHAPSTADFAGDGDVFLILDLPPDFIVGCDAKVVTAKNTGNTRPSSEPATLSIFGFRALPPGAHLIFVSDPTAMTRCGYWFVTKDGPQGEVRIKQWDRYNEVLGEPASQFEARSQRENIRSIYPKLIPYMMMGQERSSSASPKKDLPQRQLPPSPATAALDMDLDSVDDVGIWRQLTSGVTDTLLGRVTGRMTGSGGGGGGSEPSSSPASGASEWLVDTADSAKGELNFAQASKLFKAVVGSELEFLFPRDDDLGLDMRQLLALNPNLTTSGDGGKSGSENSSSSSSTGDDDGTIRSQPPITPAGRDPPPAPPSALHNPDDASPLVTAALKRRGVTESDIVGELQFAFLTAVHLGNLSCAEHWWRFVLRILLRAHHLVVSRPGLVRSLILTVHAQMVYSDHYVAGAAPSSGDPTGCTASTSSSGILDMLPQKQTRLRDALTLYKRRLNETLPDLGESITSDQAAVGHAFAGLEAWFWKYGWDLRSDYVRGSDGTRRFSGSATAAVVEAVPPPPSSSSENRDEEKKSRPRRRRPGLEVDSDDEMEGDGDGEYLPVVVELDEHGREVGLVSWNL